MKSESDCSIINHCVSAGRVKFINLCRLCMHPLDKRQTTSFI